MVEKWLGRVGAAVSYSRLVISARFSFPKRSTKVVKGLLGVPAADLGSAALRALLRAGWS